MSLTVGLKAKAKSLSYALSLIGSPYKMGGKDPKKGIDCSGFVSHVYDRMAGIDLPHNALQMSRQGIEVDDAALKPGDLVFFNTRRKPFSHVGIYVGEGEFVHAASGRSRKVTVSRLDEHYWATRYNGARRVNANPVNPDLLSTQNEGYWLERLDNALRLAPLE